MLKLMENQNYRAEIEEITLPMNKDGGVVLKGWAVDKIRHDTMQVELDSPGKVSRVGRADISTVYSLNDGVSAGFQISIPAGESVARIMLSSPGDTVRKAVNIRKAFNMLRVQRWRMRLGHLAHLSAHAWSPAGMRTLLKAVKGKFTKQQTFYDRWIERHETMTCEQAESIQSTFSRMPLISIVTPVYNVDEQWLRAFVASIQTQWYPNWELCLADDHSSAPHIRPLLEELAASDSRIKVVFRTENGRISKATNSAIELATGDYIGFADNDDELAPQALFEVVRMLNEHPQTDFIYTDEDKITESGQRFDPFFKPGFSPNLLLGHNYITHFVVVSRDLLDKVGTLRSEYDGSQDYDFVLRATEQASEVRHIPQMLYHWRTLASSVAGDPRSKMYAYEAGRKALEAALERRGLRGSVRMLDNLGTYKIDWYWPDDRRPPVIVIASGYSDGQLEKLRSLTRYPSVKFVKAASLDDAYRLVASADRQSGDGIDNGFDYVVFLDGLMPKNTSWLSQMVNYMRNPGVGIVGGKVFDSRQRVVDVGVTLRALKSGRPFEMRGEWDDGIGYYFRDLLQREMFGATEECLMISREDFLSLKGFNTSQPAGIRGIDLCVRERELHGRQTLWQPYALFVDLKKKPVTIELNAINAYLKQHSGLSDGFSSACFPDDETHKQEGIVYSIDLVEWRDHESGLRVDGWAADLHANENVDIQLGDCAGVRLESCSRAFRADVNLTLPVPADSILGFTLTLSVPGGKRSLRTNDIPLILTTSTDQRIVQVHVERSEVKRRLMEFGRKIALLRHPRTTMHRLDDKYLAPRRQIKAYQRLIATTERYDVAKTKLKACGFAYRPLISIVMPVYNVEPKWLERCIESIENQYYDNWELCMADDHSTEPHVRPLLEEYAKRDPRIKVTFREQNGHISRATNSALEIASGEFVALMDDDDELPAHALFEVVRELNDHPQTDLIYSDEDKIDEEGNRSDPHFKPDYAPDLLLSTNYISHLGVYRKSIVDQIGGFRPGYEGSQDYDLVLRFMEHSTPSRVRHIAKVLYHWRTLATSTASGSGAKNYASDAGLRALRSAVERRGVNAEVVPATTPVISGDPTTGSVVAGIYHVHYAIADPALVSVIIPTKNGYDNIERCVDSVIGKTTYPNYEIIIADNGSTNPHMQDLYDRYRRKLGFRFRVEEIDIPFNFSTINNIAARSAKGTYLLFLNDDTEVIAPDWMTRMVSFAQLSRVGVVGAKLYYPTETIQHAGIVLGLGGAAGHIQVGFPRSYLGYFGRLIENVNYYAVTAACCMIKAVDFKAVGGFDESLAVAYNDVDLCIRVHDELGRDNVWACEAELYHYESVTRGYDVKSRAKKARLERESVRFLHRYGKIVDNDPYYNPNLSRSSGNFWVRER